MSECKERGTIYVEYGGNIGAPSGGYCYQCEIDQLKAVLKRSELSRATLSGLYHDLERQLSEARAENEKIGSVLGLQEYTKHIRQEAARECYNLVNTFATPDIVFVLDAIKAKFGLVG